MPVYVEIGLHGKDFFVHGPQKVGSQDRVDLIDHAVSQADEIIGLAHPVLVAAVGVHGLNGGCQALTEGKVGGYGGCGSVGKIQLIGQGPQYLDKEGGSPESPSEFPGF